MRIILFYSGIESFNYFTDEINKKLYYLGHETFDLDLRYANNILRHSFRNTYDFISSSINTAIGYDQMSVTDPSYFVLWSKDIVLNNYTWNQIVSNIINTVNIFKRVITLILRKDVIHYEFSEKIF